MVDRVEGRAQVEQDERNELATVDCADDIVVRDEDSCLSRMVTTIRINTVSKSKRGEQRKNVHDRSIVCRPDCRWQNR